MVAVVAGGSLTVALFSLLLDGSQPLFYFGLAASCIASMTLMLSNGLWRGD